MIRSTIASAVLIVCPVILAAQTPVRIAGLKVSQPSKVAELDIDKLKGQPSRLAWSADGTQVYVQTVDGKPGQGGQKVRHYAIALADGTRQDLESEPAWAAAYWTDKSAQSSPDGPLMKIELKTEMRTEKGVSAPMGGDLARGGSVGDSSGSAGGTGAGDAMSAAYGQQPVPVHTMVVGGTVIGQFVNSVIVPGLTFGWGPKGSKVLAFADPRNGRVVVMDAQGEKREVSGSKDASLPAWSSDGKRLAWIQKDGKKKFALQVAQVDPAS